MTNTAKSVQRMKSERPDEQFAAENPPFEAYLARPRTDGRQPAPLGELLRSARAARGFSQLELANRIGVSQRHLGFLEVGRAQPSQGMLRAILDELAPPRSIRNATLLAAGFQPDKAGSARENAEFVTALGALIDAHDPWPAVLFDADWMSLGINDAGMRLCKLIMPDARCWKTGTGVVDMIDAVADPAGLLSHASTPQQIASVLLSQFWTEAWARPSLWERVHRCASELEERFGILDVGLRDPGVASFSVSFETTQGQMNFRCFQVVPGIPQDVNLNSLRVELWYPLDGQTSHNFGRDSRGIV
jgi:transcriptional regulator with XRE-family HTH domain